jgi:hypothetical protein
VHLPNAIQRLIDLYEATDKKERSRRLRKQLEDWNALLETKP